MKSTSLAIICFLASAFLIPSRTLASATSTTTRATSIFGTPLAFDEITIVIPSTHSIRHPLPPSLRANILSGMCHMLAGIAGGVTAVDGDGHWVPSDGFELVKENVTLLSVSLNASEEVLREVYEMSRWLAGRLGQEAVLVKVNAVAYLVSPTQTFVLGH
ncbi:hypothetical protein HK104_007465 [Borealophlyctis nickersoniae]|nr:hypothetical protein HK104_007465 [Borealophlyctis nickersoniae]